MKMANSFLGTLFCGTLCRRIFFSVSGFVILIHWSMRWCGDGRLSSLASLISWRRGRSPSDWTTVNSGP